MRSVNLLLLVLLASPIPSHAQVSKSEPYFLADCRINRESGYAAGLALVQEPSLLKQSREGKAPDSYRLTILGPFSDLPDLVVRAEIDVKLGMKLFVHDMPNGMKIRSESKSLSPEQSRQLETAFAATTLGPEPAQMKLQGDKFVSADAGIRDGMSWLIEALENGKYRCAERRPYRPSQFRDLGLMLLNLAGRNDHANR